MLDPVVIAAAVALGGSLVSAVLNLDRSFEHEQSRCARAFAFLQDEAINPNLQKDEAFYRVQLAIARRCSLAKD